MKNIPEKSSLTNGGQCTSLPVVLPARKKFRPYDCISVTQSNDSRKAENRCAESRSIINQAIQRPFPPWQSEGSNSGNVLEYIPKRRMAAEVETGEKWILRRRSIVETYPHYSALRQYNLEWSIDVVEPHPSLHKDNTHWSQWESGHHTEWSQRLCLLVQEIRKQPWFFFWVYICDWRVYVFWWFCSGTSVFLPQMKVVRLDKCVYREQDQVCMIVPCGARIEVAGVDKAIRICLVS